MQVEVNSGDTVFEAFFLVQCSGSFVWIMASMNC